MGFLSKALAGALQGTVGTALGLVKDNFTLFGLATGEGPESIKQISEAGEKLGESVEDLAKGKIL